jgi:hypothetical protein
MPVGLERTFYDRKENRGKRAREPRNLERYALRKGVLYDHAQT